MSLRLVRRPATMAAMKCRQCLIRPFAAVGIAIVLSACAQLHESTAALHWQDAWGDRGRQVLARDHAMCQRLVEHRRSLLANCLASRGWSV